MKLLISEFDDDNNWIRSIEIDDADLIEDANFYRVSYRITGRLRRIYEASRERNRR